MFKPIPVAIGLRYLRAKRRNGFISFISLASILGIALGVTALITTLAVMSGFQREIRDRMLQMAAHATVSGYGEPLHGLAAGGRRSAVRTSASPAPRPTSKPRRCCAARATSRRSCAAWCRPKSARFRCSASKMVAGQARLADARQLQHRARQGTGDVARRRRRRQRRSSPPTSRPRRWARCRSSSASRSAASSKPATTNSTRAWPSCNLQDAQRLLRMGDGVTGVRLKLHDMDQACDVARDLALQACRGPTASATGRSENANMFRALKMEKTVMAILLSLIIAMGAFNLVSSQVMLVTDKQADIAILRTLGPDAARRDAGVHGAGHADRRHRHRAGRGRRHRCSTLNLEHILRGDRDACSACSCCRRTCTTSPACRPSCNADDVVIDRAGGAGDGVRRHDLSGLARRAHGAGGGAAL